jgi:hypothetical protein
VNPNATWSISLESYYPYLQPQKVSKTPQTYSVHNTLPKSAKSHFGYLCPLGIKQYKISKNHHIKSVTFKSIPTNFIQKLLKLCLQSNIEGILNFIIKN